MAMPLRCANAKISSGSSEPSMCMCSSALGMARSSAGRRSAAMAWEKGRRSGMGRAAKSRGPCLLLVAAGHLAFDTLHIEVHAREELVVGYRVLGHQLLAVLADDRALPDREAAVLQASLDFLDLGLGLG